MLYEFWHNFTHNLFKPLLLFFYMGEELSIPVDRGVSGDLRFG